MGVHSSFPFRPEVHLGWSGPHSVVVHMGVRSHPQESLRDLDFQADEAGPLLPDGGAQGNCSLAFILTGLLAVGECVSGP